MEKEEGGEGNAWVLVEKFEADNPRKERWTGPTATVKRRRENMLTA